MKRFLTGLTLVLLPAASVAQPYSASMAECAAVYQNAAQWVQTEEAAQKLIFAHGQWAAAAVAQAKAEGIADADAAMMARIDAKTDEWEAKGAGVFMTEEFRDWTSYCRKFGKDRGIDWTQ